MLKIENRKGITLIEVVLTLALIGLITQVVYSVFFVGGNSFAVSNNKGFSQQGVRNTIIFLESELKYANNFFTDQNVEEGITNTNFYGLQKQGDFLVVSKYEYKEDTVPPEYNESEVRRFRCEWTDGSLNNKEMGQINIYIN